jgi:molybdate transport system ATP-binding protein
MCPTVADLLTGDSIENRSPYLLDPPRVDAHTYEVRRRRAVRLLGISHLLDRKVIHLSNGEGRKVLLARVLMQAPRLLILDDPFGGLDRASRKAFRECLETILGDENGPTVILASPRAEEIPSDITHLAVVENSALVRTLRWEDQGAADLLKPSAKGPRSNAPAAPFPPPMSPKPKAAHDPEDSPLISVKKATVKYGKTVVLRDVNWTVNEGEKWAVLGPNGAGKTALLSLILGDNPQSYSNEIAVFGKKRGAGVSVWDVKASIGYVSPDIQALYPPETSCLRVVLSGFFDSIGLHTPPSAAQEGHARNWMRCLGLAGLESVPFGELSLGQGRLLLLARALVCQQEWLSLICVSHHQDEIPRAVGHVLHLAGGEVKRVERRRAT